MLAVLCHVPHVITYHMVGDHDRADPTVMRYMHCLSDRAMLLDFLLVLSWYLMT